MFYIRDVQRPIFLYTGVIRSVASGIFKHFIGCFCHVHETKVTRTLEKLIGFLLLSLKRFESDCGEIKMNVPLKYIPFETVVDTAFWHVLATRKLNDFRLSEGPFPITAEFTNNLAEGLSPRVMLDNSSFEGSDIKKYGAPSCKLLGEMTIVNSLDQFKAIDKQNFIDIFGKKLFERALESSAYVKNPDLLLAFQLLAYCDLKKHKFFFWFAYPAVIHEIQPRIVGLRRLGDEMSEKQINEFLCLYDRWRMQNSSTFFCIRINNESQLDINSFANYDVHDNNNYLVFCDPSTSADFPGWPLRNILYALSASVVTETRKIHVVCFRERCFASSRSCDHSLVIDVELDPVNASELTRFVGWEKTENKLKPRVVDLSTSLDPIKLAESAVDLNLKLMKWRLMPDLNLDIIRKTKCLLIGSGTLGCNISRQLLAWGFRHITFVDNATVSMSNPVRQTLFTFHDAKEKSTKSHAAAVALSTIFPGVSAKGVQIDIPMPGHPIGRCVVDDYSIYPRDLNNATINAELPDDIRKTYLACCSLNELIINHDVIFLLTDTRESRWLPSVLAYSHQKFTINVALGFDSYLVMRHGVKRNESSNDATISGSPNDSLTVSGCQLGCYFCTDVVGPTDSTQNRAMDQQCTVTRPGVSMIASALAVELLTNILHHPGSFFAPAPIVLNTESGFPSTQSSVPHQIRGFLSQYSNIFPTTTAFTNCSACSDTVHETLKRDGFRFLLHVFNDADYLEHVCGLAALRNSMDHNDIIALSDEEQSDS